jgi:protein-S-isoprenylcysteine O-methyltransferase Ste14
MADRIPTDTSQSMASLLGGIVSDIQTLIRQELALARTEIQREWDKAKTAAGSMAVGSAILALGGILLCLMVVHLLAWAFGYPGPGKEWALWVSYLIVGGVLAVLGAVLFYTGRNKAGQVNVIPPQTAETMRENVEWLQNPNPK